MRRNDFGENFIWGIACSAYQIEGAHNIDGKGISIWDVFSEKRNKIANREDGKTACDFYHRYPEDLANIKSLNIPNFRFSIAWTRLIPEGTGKINYKGIDFYNKIIDGCIELGITPWITLYHWDLPYYLELKGGWTNRSIIQWFENYVELCVQQFGDRVKHWMVLNEPVAFTGAGYFLGIHAPGKRGVENYLSSVHHAALCQAEGARIIKGYYPNSQVGSTFSYSHVDAHTETKKDYLAVEKIDALLNRLFIEPSLGMGYPTEKLPFLNKIETFIKPGDYKRLQYNFDFIGLQTYTREVVKHSFFTPVINAVPVNAKERNVSRTLMNWEIHPPSIYQAIKRMDSYSGVKKIYITENGAAFNDIIIDNSIQDQQRIKYLDTHLQEVLRAKEENMKVEGYFVWSLTDNFEWAEGYHPRFGLIYVDFKTQKRIIKQSGYWYKKFLENRN